MDLQTVIFIGRSGAGKGTQSKRLNAFLEEHHPKTPVLYIETGAYFRRHIQEAGYTWDRSRKVNEIGKRQPEFLAIWMWAQAFIDNIHGREHIVIDGMPRSLDEARILDTALSFYERPTPTVVFLNVSRTWAEDRLRGRGRPDDISPEVVARRLSWYDEDVAPAVEFYKNDPAYRFIEVDGEQTPEEVFNDITSGLNIR
ncbi:MAG: adenylate kinase family protein [Minisyncoccota bacterium]